MNFNDLKSYKSISMTATSMVTLAIPHRYNLTQLRQKMLHEKTTAYNIRNTSNRKSVSTALTKINSFLSELKEIPSTGLLICAEQYI